MRFGKDFKYLCMVSLVFTVLFLQMYSNQKEVLVRASEGYATGSVCNIDQTITKGKLVKLLLGKGYLSDIRDANFIADTILRRTDKKPLPNLGTLNKRQFRIPASAADSLGGTKLKQRVRQSLAQLGYNEEIELLYEQHISTVCTKPGSDGTTIEVFIKDKEAQPISGVVVRLKEHFFNDSIDNEGDLIGRHAQDSLVGYALSGADGIARFKVNRHKFYSVLPVRKGYEYGRPKGTTRGGISDDVTVYNFIQNEHDLSLFDSYTYSRIKQDQSLTIRTPEQYKEGLLLSYFLFMFSWWGLYTFICLWDKRTEHTSNRNLLVVLMTLTGIGLIAIFSISNPLIDSANGVSTAWGILMGVFAMGLMSIFNYISFYHSSWFYLKIGILRKTAKSGYLYFGLAIILTTLLICFGTGPEGSDARVNLWILQPSEFSKYLMVIFMAAFFAQNQYAIQQFVQRKGDYTLKHWESSWLWLRAKRVVAVLAAEFILLTVYVLGLSDMGPALVLLVTFILLYSVCRKDTIQLFLGVGSFLLMLFLTKWYNDTTGSILVATLAWVIIWICIGMATRRQVFESAVFMNLVIVTFLSGGDLLVAIGRHEGLRLLNRTQMSWSGVWENCVMGGDQIAQGLWGLASGGLWGQGLAKGSPSLIPAGHTDMIFESIGEIMGWFVLVLIVCCFALLLLYSIRIARKTGNMFAFFLVSGIAVVTSVQFLVIVSGSLGLIPLTGVSVPLLSFGKSSMIATLSAFGIVLSLSRERQSSEKLKAINEEIKSHDNIQLTSLAVFAAAAILIIGSLAVYQWDILKRDHYLVKPAFVINTNGAFVAEYNPRIFALLGKIDAGNIYDRNGILLATSRVDTVKKQRERLINAGISRKSLDQLERRHLSRYYPFGNHLLFMLGDQNTGIVRDESELYPRGYAAEYRHMKELRGFDNLRRDSQGKIMSRRLTSRHFIGSQFLPTCEETFEIPMRDFSDPRIISMLKDGITGEKVKQWNMEREKRDLWLTIDAQLQSQLEEKMYTDIKEDKELNSIKKLRASVVILNAKTGELLCSSNYPLPSEDSIRIYNNYSEGIESQPAITDRDLGTTYYSLPGSTAKIISAMAAFKKEGVKAATANYHIEKQEIIGHDEPGNISMKQALVKSSNCYFINLVHDRDLYPQLSEIYQLAGIQIEPLYGTKEKSVIPYYYYRSEMTGDRNGYSRVMSTLGKVGCSDYLKYMEKTRETRKGYKKMNRQQWGIAWGQHHIYATPLDMARCISIVANRGKFIPTSYILNEQNTAIDVLSQSSADSLRSFLMAESDKHRKNMPNLPTEMGGKTGTPTRDWHYLVNGEVQMEKNINDGWYVCFVESSYYAAPLAIAVRLERVGLTRPRNRKGSASAVRFVDTTVLPLLKELKYLK